MIRRREAAGRKRIMNGPLADWARTLNRGARRVFGFLTVDIAKHTSPGPDHLCVTRDKFHQRVASSFGQHGRQELAWADDGGAFVYLIDQSSDYDRMVTLAVDFLESMQLFNATKTLNTLFTPIHVRVSCHKGEASWDPDLSNFYGKTVNYFLKSERDVGTEDSISVTEEVHEQIDAQLGKLFTPLKGHSYEVSGRPYERAIYMICARAWSVLPSNPLSRAVPDKYLDAMEHTARTHPEGQTRMNAAHAVWMMRPDRALPLLEDGRLDRILGLVGPGPGRGEYDTEG
jgi:hypothetical protein